MTDGIAVLDQWARTLRDVPELGVKAAPAVAKVVESALVGTIGSGIAPDGTPWQPTLKGAKPDLGSKLRVAEAHNSVLVTLGGKSFLHHTGRARGKIVRQVIPVDQLPPEIAQLVADTLADTWREHFEGK
jgi:hypothetical protein